MATAKHIINLRNILRNYPNIANNRQLINQYIFMIFSVFVYLFFGSSCTSCETSLTIQKDLSPEHRKLVERIFFPRKEMSVMLL